MTAKLLLGKEVSDSIYAELRERISVLASKGVKPCLAVVMVGDDPASQTYVRMKRRKCDELGIRSVDANMPEGTSQGELLAMIGSLNDNPGVDGILIQYPIPGDIDYDAVVNAIDPAKDVDCFHPSNVGRMFVGEPTFLPATPAGILQMLLRSGVETEGKHVVVVGRSSVVGRPIAALMMQKGVDSTVTVVNSHTRDIAAYTRTADILIVAVGRPGLVTADMVKEGAVVIDVGTNRVPDPEKPNGRLVGDVDFGAVSEKASMITPVPGGVGPMTICMLMENTVRAAERRSGIDQRVRGARILPRRELPRLREEGQVRDV